MKTSLPFQLFLFFIAAICYFPSHSQSPVKTSPGVPDYGEIWHIENAVKPNPDMDYKLVIDLKTKIENPEELNRGLNNVARMINLHRTGGIAADRLKVAVAVHGGATALVINNDGYQKKYGTDNPNLELIAQLREAGVELFVCGQSLIGRGYDFDQVNPEVKIGLSMLTVVSEKMMTGYEMFVFN